MAVPNLLNGWTPDIWAESDPARALVPDATAAPAAPAVTPQVPPFQTAPAPYVAPPAGPQARGTRNNNPGNIEFGPFARQMGAIGSDGRFAIFPDMETGARAAEALLVRYMGRGTNTVQDIIDTWAPPSEAANARNRTGYIGAVARALGVRPDEALTAQHIPMLARAMFNVESPGWGTGGPAMLGGPGTTAPGAGPLTQFAPATQLPGNVARPGWLGILDQTGLATPGAPGTRPMPQGGFTPYGAWFDQMPVQHQQAAAQIYMRGQEIQAANPGWNPQQVAQALLRDPVFGRNAMYVGMNAPALLTAASNRPGPKPEYQNVPYGGSLVPIDPQSGQAGVPITPQPHQEPRQPVVTTPPGGISLVPDPTQRTAYKHKMQDGRDIDVPAGWRAIEAGPVNPNVNPIAQRRAEILERTMTAGQSAQRAGVNYPLLRQYSDQWEAAGWRGGLSTSAAIALNQRFGVNIGEGTAPLEAFTSVVNGMVAGLDRTPGSISNYEAEQLIAQLPQLKTTAAGRREIIDRLERATTDVANRGRIAGVALSHPETAPEALRLLNAPRDVVTQAFYDREMDQAGLGVQVGDRKLTLSEIYLMTDGQFRQFVAQVEKYYEDQTPPRPVPEPLADILRARRAEFRFFEEKR